MKKVLSIATALLLSGGCGLMAAVAQQSTSGPKPTATTQSPPSQPIVELLTAGATPRQSLRFKPAVNSKQIATMTMNMAMGLTIAGQPTPINQLPATVMTFETLVDQIDPNGDIHYQFRYTNVDLVGGSKLPPAQRAQLRTQLQKLKGIQGKVVVDNRGQTKFGKFDLSPDLNSTDKQMLKQISHSVEQLSSPVPEPALGVGATWRILSSPKLNGLTLKQITTYKLVSIQDGAMTLDVTLEQQAPPQPMAAAGLTNGRTLNLKSLVGTGQGQTIVKLDRLIPVSSSMSSQLRSDMESPNPSGAPMKMTTSTKMELTLKSK
jgi:hypothetical protein